MPPEADWPYTLPRIFKGTYQREIGVKTLIRRGCGVLSLLTLATQPFSTATAKESLSIGTGSKSGVYFPTGRAICHLLNDFSRKKGRKYTCAAHESLGSVANLQALADGKIKLAVVQSDAHYHAVKGIRKFKGKPITSLRSLFSLHAEAFTVIARTDVSVRKLAHLKGKRINVGIKGSGPRETFLELMATLGWKASDVAGFTQFGADEQVKALCDGRTDVITYVVGHPADLVRRAARSCATNLVNIHGPGVNKLLKKWPYYRKTRIPAGLYRGNNSDIRTFGLSATLVTTDKLDTETAHDLVAAIFGNLGKFRSMHPALKYLGAAEMTKGSLSAPLHEGAKRYFQENGLR
ncbi:MAG: TAXI family TRAP transporter solute-binding subunit [Rhodospirillaceae bacterium]|nr:TAXI family TRAP transporter solute-binding subunit [Rhodospirillaceae bacterium]